MFWTNLKLIKFVLCFCFFCFFVFVFFVFLVFSFFFFLFHVLCFPVQMSPTKHSTLKRTSKGPRTDSDNFISADADMAYNDCYKRATIIMERVVIPMRTLAYLKYSKRGHGRSCWIRVELCTQKSSKSSSRMLVWTEIILTTGWDTRNLWLQGNQSKNSLKFVLLLSQSLCNMMIVWNLLRRW